MSFRTKKNLYMYCKSSYILLVVAACAIVSGGEESSATVGKTKVVSTTGLGTTGNLQRTGSGGLGSSSQFQRTSSLGSGSSSSSGSGNATIGSTGRLSVSSVGGGVSQQSGLVGIDSSSGLPTGKIQHKYGVSAGEFKVQEVPGGINPGERYVQFININGKLVTYKEGLSTKLKLLWSESEIGRDHYIGLDGKVHSYIYRSKPRWVSGEDILNVQGGDGGSSSLTQQQGNISSTIVGSGNRSIGTQTDTGTLTGQKYTSQLNLAVGKDGSITQQNKRTNTGDGAGLGTSAGISKTKLNVTGDGKVVSRSIGTNTGAPSGVSETELNINGSGKVTTRSVGTNTVGVRETTSIVTPLGGDKDFSNSSTQTLISGSGLQPKKRTNKGVGTQTDLSITGEGLTSLVAKSDGSQTSSGDGVSIPVKSVVDNFGRMPRFVSKGSEGDTVKSSISIGTDVVSGGGKTTNPITDIGTSGDDKIYTSTLRINLSGKGKQSTGSDDKQPQNQYLADMSNRLGSLLLRKDVDKNGGIITTDYTKQILGTGGPEVVSVKPAADNKGTSGSGASSSLGQQSSSSQTGSGAGAQGSSGGDGSGGKKTSPLGQQDGDDKGIFVSKKDVAKFNPTYVGKSLDELIKMSNEELRKYFLNRNPEQDFKNIDLSGAKGLTGDQLDDFVARNPVITYELDSNGYTIIEVNNTAHILGKGDKTTRKFFDKLPDGRVVEGILIDKFLGFKDAVELSRQSSSTTSTSAVSQGGNTTGTVPSGQTVQFETLGGEGAQGSSGASTGGSKTSSSSSEKKGIEGSGNKPMYVGISLKNLEGLSKEELINHAGDASVIDWDKVKLALPKASTKEEAKDLAKKNPVVSYGVDSLGDLVEVNNSKWLYDVGEREVTKVRNKDGTWLNITSLGVKFRPYQSGQRVDSKASSTGAKVSTSGAGAQGSGGASQKEGSDSSSKTGNQGGSKVLTSVVEDTSQTSTSVKQQKQGEGSGKVDFDEVRKLLRPVSGGGSGTQGETAEFVTSVVKVEKASSEVVAGKKSMASLLSKKTQQGTSMGTEVKQVKTSLKKVLTVTEEKASTSSGVDLNQVNKSSQQDLKTSGNNKQGGVIESELQKVRSSLRGVPIGDGMYDDVGDNDNLSNYILLKRGIGARGKISPKKSVTSDENLGNSQGKTGQVGTAVKFFEMVIDEGSKVGVSNQRGSIFVRTATSKEGEVKITSTNVVVENLEDVRPLNIDTGFAKILAKNINDGYNKKMQELNEKSPNK